MPDIFGKQNLPGVEIPKRPGRVRGALRPRLRGNRPGNHRQVCKGNKRFNSFGRLRVLQDGEKENQRVGKTCLPRKTHWIFHDCHHAATHEHCETLQNERLQGGVLLHRAQGRSQEHFRKLPLCVKTGGEKDYGNFEEGEVRTVGDPDGASVHAQSRDRIP